MKKENRWLAVGLASVLAAMPFAGRADEGASTDAGTGAAEETQTDPAQTEGAPGAADAEVTNPGGPSSKSAGGINPTFEDEGTAELQRGGSDESATGSDADVDGKNGAEMDTGAYAASGTGAADSDVTNPQPPSSKSAGGINPGTEAEGSTGSGGSDDAAGSTGISGAADDDTATGAGSTGTSGVDAPNVEGGDDPSTKSPGSINPSE